MITTIFVYVNLVFNIVFTSFLSIVLVRATKAEKKAKEQKQIKFNRK